MLGAGEDQCWTGEDLSPSHVCRIALGLDTVILCSCVNRIQDAEPRNGECQTCCSMTGKREC